MAEEGIDLRPHANDVNKDNHPPLYLACSTDFKGFTEDEEEDKKIVTIKRSKIVKLLLKAGAKVNYSSPIMKMTALHWAAYQGCSDVVRALLDYGAQPEMNLEKNTPVDIAGFTN